MQWPGRQPRPVGLVLLGLVVAGLAALIMWASPQSWWRPAVVAVLFVLVIVVAGVLVAPGWLVARDTTVAELTAEQRANAVNNARGTIVNGTVGLLAVLGIAVAWLQLQNDQEQFQLGRQQLSEQLATTRQGQVAERFTHAIDQLSSEKLELRLGGIYGLEQIAKEPGDGGYRLVVFEVLTAYIRQHALRDLEASGLDTEVTYLGMRAPDVQAAITVLGRRTALATDPPLDLSDTDLSVRSFVHARLQGVNFIGALLPATDFTDAQLQNASMPGVLLWNADFTNAQLQGANLGDAKVRNPDFHGARCDAKTILPEGYECTATGEVRPPGVMQ
jgi:hypothetical protein